MKRDIHFILRIPVKGILIFLSGLAITPIAYWAWLDYSIFNGCRIADAVVSQPMRPPAFTLIPRAIHASPSVNFFGTRELFQIDGLPKSCHKSGQSSVHCEDRNSPIVYITILPQTICFMARSDQYIDPPMHDCVGAIMATLETSVNDCSLLNPFETVRVAARLVAAGILSPQDGIVQPIVYLRRGRLDILAKNKYTSDWMVTIATTNGWMISVHSRFQSLDDLLNWLDSVDLSGIAPDPKFSEAELSNGDVAFPL